MSGCVWTAMKKKSKTAPLSDIDPFHYRNGMIEILMAMQAMLPEKFDDFRIPFYGVFALDGRQYKLTDVITFLHAGGHFKDIRENVKSKEFKG